MGKSKKRNLAKNNDKDLVFLKRNDVIKQIILDIRTNTINENTVRYFDLFGITAEELTEAGVSYEELSAVKYLLA